MESHIYGRCFYLVWGTEVEPENTRGSEKDISGAENTESTYLERRLIS